MPSLSDYVNLLRLPQVLQLYNNASCVKSQGLDSLPKLLLLLLMPKRRKSSCSHYHPVKAAFHFHCDIRAWTVSNACHALFAAPGAGAPYCNRVHRSWSYQSVLPGLFKLAIDTLTIQLGLAANCFTSTVLPCSTCARKSPTNLPA